MWNCEFFFNDSKYFYSRNGFVFSPLDKKFGQNSKRGHINGTIGYALQIPWIQKDTIKSNILFFKKCNKEKYEEVLDKCQLNYDLSNLEGKDLTEIG